MTSNLHKTGTETNPNPNRLLDGVIARLKLKNDAALARALEVAPPVISKIRHLELQVGASLLIRMMDAADMTLRELRDLLGTEPAVSFKGAFQ